MEKWDQKKHWREEEKYKVLFEEHHSIMLMIDPGNGNIMDANNKALAFYGYEKKVLLNMKIYDLNLLDRKEINNKMNSVSLNKQKNFQFKHKLANGEIRDVEVNSILVKINNKDYLYSIITDLTELHLQETMVRELLQKSPLAILVLDHENKIIDINENFTSVFKYTSQEILGLTPVETIYPQDSQDNIVKNLKIVREKRIMKQETKRRDKLNRILDVELIAFPIIQNDKHLATFVIYNDITAQKKQEEEMKKLIFKDHLTGLHNRLYVMKKLEEQILIARQNEDKIGILYMDIDDFKSINDNLGHSTGDKIIKHFGKRLINVVDQEHIVSRIGGDEFIVLIPSIQDINMPLEIASRITESLRDSFIVNENELFITVSIGICMYPQDGLDCENLIKNADIAMYKAKESSNISIEVFHNNMQSNIEENFILQYYLKNAIKNNEAYLVYQPITDLKNQNVVGAEALMRWENPYIGSVSPLKFIPIAEKNGYIYQMGEWVLEEACKYAQALHNKGFYQFRISVNVSVRQLEQVDFYTVVLKALTKAKLDPSHLILEVTESIYSKQLEFIKNNLEQMKKIGVKIAIDDFGTGYSSLAKLKDLQIDILKIDKSFIADIYEDHDKDEIILAILAMAQKLNFKVISEGIETMKQNEFLIQNNCTYGQGYLFGKPMEKQSLEKFLMNQHNILESR